MSAATRRPYLGESVHIQNVSRAGEESCRPAVVTAMKNDEIEVYYFGRPEPRYIGAPPHDEVDRAKGSWHFASH